ncbi:MAG: TolC family protein [Cyclobacteriaceae bacterium]
MLKNKIKATLLVVLLTALSISANAQDHAYSLEECIKIAFENNLNVQRGTLDQQSAEITLKESKMSRLPDLNVGSGYGRSWGRSINSVTNEFETIQRNSAGINGSSSMALFNGMQITNSIRQSIIDLEAGRADLEKVKNDVTLSVANLYLNVIFNDELQKNAQLQVKSTNEQLGRTKTLVDAGALPRTNLLDIQAQLATNELNQINAENNYNLAVLQLKQALLIPASDAFAIEVPEFEVEDAQQENFQADDIYKTAETTQPEIKSADLRVRSADLGMKISKGSYMPRLSLSAGLNTNYSNSPFSSQRPIYDGDEIIEVPFGYLASDPSQQVISSLSQPKLVGVDQISFTEQLDENLSQNINLNLQIPIFSRWRNKATVQRSLIAKRRAELISTEVRNNLRQTIETAYNNYVAAAKSYSASERQVTALEESYRVIETQYNAGAVNFVEYQIAANNLYMARSDKLRAKYDYIFKRKVLDFYLGNPLTFK